MHTNRCKDDNGRRKRTRMSKKGMRVEYTFSNPTMQMKWKGKRILDASILGKRHEW